MRLEQIHLLNWTNTLYDLNKYILVFDWCKGLLWPAFCQMLPCGAVLPSQLWTNIDIAIGQIYLANTHCDLNYFILLFDWCKCQLWLAWCQMLPCGAVLPATQLWTNSNIHINPSYSHQYFITITRIHITGNPWNPLLAN